jgi:molybdopterin molybdotransferase
MPEFFNVLLPEEALSKFLSALCPAPQPETVPLAEALDRVTFESVCAPVSVPAFPRSMMDGYALRAQDTFGASPSLPMYLTVKAEVPMGCAPDFEIGPGQAALVHTGGMLPRGTDAVVMVEVTQKVRENEIEILKAMAPGENVLSPGDDVTAGTEVLPAGHWLRAQDLGGLAALGLTPVTVARRPRVALLATGNEIVSPESAIEMGQVRDVNSYSVGGQIARAGGIPIRFGIAPDDFNKLRAAAEAALKVADMLVLSAGSSVSVRDMSIDVANALGPPGALVHGVAIKPGKPTILAVANGKPLVGLPGNPVSAMISTDLFVIPAVHRLLGCRRPPARPLVRAKLTHNVASRAGRVDYQPVRLVKREGETWAEPAFGKSNQIFLLVRADGIVTISRDTNGLSAGEMVEVRLF